MSQRSISRQIKQTKARKEKILRSFAVQHFGAEASLADIHPDIKFILGLVWGSFQARLAGNPEVEHHFTDLIDAWCRRYHGQENALTPHVERGAIDLTSNPQSVTNHPGTNAMGDLPDEASTVPQPCDRQEHGSESPQAS